MSSNYDMPETIPNGIKIGNRVIGWPGAIKQFDGSRFDSRNSEGMRWLACIMDAVDAGWIALGAEKELILWRWLVATVFINEEKDKTVRLKFLTRMAALISRSSTRVRKAI